MSFKPFFYDPTTNIKPIILGFLLKTFCGLKPSAWVIVDITKLLFDNKFIIFHSFIITSKQISTPISSLSVFESIVNMKLLNISLFIGVVLLMLLKYDTAELRFWLGSMGNVNNVWLRLPCLPKFLAELIELQLRVTYLSPRLISMAFRLFHHIFCVTVLG